MRTSVMLLILTFFCFQSLFPQGRQNNSHKQNPGDNQLTLPDYQRTFNDYWDKFNVKDGYYLDNGEKKKAPGWKIFKRWEWYWENRVNIKSGEFPTTTSDIEYKKSLNNLKKVTTLNESWVNLGTNSSDGGYAGIGRINCVAFHPLDANTFWVGSPSGGTWKTTNGGSSWTILNNDELVLGVSDIVIPSDYATTNTLYIATGDRDGGSMASLGGGQSADNVTVGVYKSTDGGTTWSATGLTFSKSPGKRVFSLIIHPSDNSILLASTSDGVYKTTDGGTNWNLTPNSYPCWRIAFKPGDPTIVYGTETYAGDQYFDRSTNTGDSWDGGNFYGSGSDALRTELAVTPDDPSIVYLLCSNSAGGLNGVYKSTDSGINFSVVNSGSPAGMFGYYTDGSGGSGGQGSYDWCIAVDPSNADVVYAGGITTWKSTNGGVNWTAINNWTPSAMYNISGVAVTHADKHALAFQNSTTLFEGNDGGIYKTTNGGTNWTDLTNGMVISQLYRIGVSQTSSTTVLTGLQDNGSKLFSSGSWSDVKGGDGMECIVDYSNSNYMYATYIRGQISRSINGGLSFPTNISANITGGQPTGAWVTPYVIDPNNSSTLIAAYDSVWKTTDRGNNWTGISGELSNTTKLRSLAIAPSNSGVLYTADLTKMWKTTDGGATSWTDISSSLPSNSNSITYIAVHNTDPNTLWITYGGYTDGAKVYQSTNGGTSWTNISTGLPNLPVMCIVHYTNITDRNVLFVGTDLGVYLKDGSSDWASYNSGLPNVVITELEIYYASGGNNDKLRAGTYGRGLWETEIITPFPVELTLFTGTAVDNKVILKWTTETEVNNYGFSIERSSSSLGTGWKTIGFVEGSGNSNSPKQYSFIDSKPIGGSTIYYRLKLIDNDGSYEYSEQIEVNINPATFSLNQNYPNPFNPITKIEFSVPYDGETVQLIIYDVLGNEIETLVNEKKSSGIYSVAFDGSNLPSGLYFYRLQASKFTKTMKMILLK